MADCFPEEKRSWVMSRIRGKNTKPETTLRSLLHARGYRFRLHRRDLPGKPDIVFPKYRVAVLVNGCFWHAHECQRGRLPKSNTDYWNQKIARNKRRDAEHVKNLQRLGWEPVVIWECELKKNSGVVLDRITKVLKSRAL